MDEVDDLYCSYRLHLHQSQLSVVVLSAAAYSGAAAAWYAANWEVNIEEMDSGQNIILQDSLESLRQNASEFLDKS